VTAQASSPHQNLKLVERYQVAERLSEGALCAVYRGQDLTLRRPIIIKVVPPQQSEPYRAALRLASSFAHPAVVCLYDMIEQDGSLYLVQEYVAARALNYYLTTGLPMERAVDIARQIAFALSYAHAKDVLHGDLTPAAVLIDRNAIVRLNNFCSPADQEYFIRTREDMARDMGLDTMPADVPAGASGDVAALGNLLWLMTTQSTSPNEATSEGGSRSLRADVPETLIELIRRSASAPDEPSSISAAEFAVALERLSREFAATHAPSASKAPAAVQAYRALVESDDWANTPTVANGRSALEQVARAAPGQRRGGTRVLPTEAEVASSALVEAPFGVAPRLRLPTRPLGERGSLRAATPEYADISDASLADDIDEKSGGVPLAPLLLLGVVLFVLFFLVGFYSFALAR
jgi:serine/threonine protein kinase